jgi:hypothetical protein
MSQHHTLPALHTPSSPLAITTPSSLPQNSTLTPDQRYQTRPHIVNFHGSRKFLWPFVSSAIWLRADWYLFMRGSNFCCGLPEFCRLLGCYAEQGGFTPTFRDYMSVPSSRVKICKKTPCPLKMGPTLGPETSVLSQPTLRNIPEYDRIQASLHSSTRRHRPENLHLQQIRCENFEYCIYT